LETITILLDADEQGALRVQLVPSGGVEAAAGIEACWRAMRMFQSQLIAEEVERQVTERMEAAEEADDAE